jgi:hypothetical protein
MATRKTRDTAPTKAPKAPKATSPARIQRRFWLTYPPRRIQAPVIWELGHKFPLVTNIRQASVTDEVGIVCLEIDGAAAAIEAGVKWLKRSGVSVEPVELNAMES